VCLFVAREKKMSDNKEEEDYSFWSTVFDKSVFLDETQHVSVDSDCDSGGELEYNPFTSTDGVAALAKQMESDVPKLEPPELSGNWDVKTAEQCRPVYVPTLGACIIVAERRKRVAVRKIAPVDAFHVRVTEQIFSVLKKSAVLMKKAVLQFDPEQNHCICIDANGKITYDYWESMLNSNSSRNVTAVGALATDFHVVRAYCSNAQKEIMLESLDTYSRVQQTINRICISANLPSVFLNARVGKNSKRRNVQLIFVDKE